MPSFLINVFQPNITHTIYHLWFMMFEEKKSSANHEDANMIWKYKKKKFQT